MTSLKETIEVSDSPAPQEGSQTKADSGHLRSDAVSLDVAVKVHGSRVTEVVLGVTPHTEPFEEQTSTMIVFPLGGVLRMATPLSAGQAIVLTNLKSRQDAICRVVKVRTNPNLHSYVEIEFTHPQPGYWGVYFPSEGPPPAKKATLPAHTPDSTPNAAHVSSPAPASEVHVVERKSVHEASSTLSRPVPSKPAVKSDAPVAVPAPIDSPAVGAKKDLSAVRRPSKTFTASASAESFSMAQLRGDASATATEAPVDAEPASQASEAIEGPHAITTPHPAPEAAPFGRFAASASLGTTEASGENPDAGRKWLFGVAAVFALTAIGGGAFYFRSHLRAQPAAPSVVVTAPPAPALPAETNAVNNTSAAPTSTQPETQPSPAALISAPVAAVAAPLSARASAPVVVHTDEEAVAKPLKASKHGQSESAASAEAGKEKAQPPTPIPDMFGALNAHPVSAQHGDATQNDVAPSIDAQSVAGQASPLPGVSNTPVTIAPVPEPAPEGPVPVGGSVPAPRIIVSAEPIYPEIARAANAQGAVVVRVVIDKTGKVTEAKAVSGSILLRKAAEEALLKYRYAPSKLRGQPVSVEMLVTVQFHL